LKGSLKMIELRKKRKGEKGCNVGELRRALSNIQAGYNKGNQ